MPNSKNKPSNLESVWAGKGSKPFNLWIRAVADANEESGLTLEAAARIVGTNPAEMEAVLQLALLGDEELDALGAEAPPRTTWFMLASLGSAEKIREALELLKTRKAGQPPSSMLIKFDPSHDEHSRTEKIATLNSDIFKALSAKAKRYSLLNDKSRSAMFSFGVYRGKGKVLSDKQAAYAEDLITQLIKGGAICRNSADGDSEMCDILLDLFGK